MNRDMLPTQISHVCVRNNTRKRPSKQRCPSSGAHCGGSCCFRFPLILKAAFSSLQLVLHVVFHALEVASLTLCCSPWHGTMTSPQLLGLSVQVRNSRAVTELGAWTCPRLWASFQPQKIHVIQLLGLDKDNECDLSGKITRRKAVPNTKIKEQVKNLAFWLSFVF